MAYRRRTPGLNINVGDAFSVHGGHSTKKAVPQSSAQPNHTTKTVWFVR